MQPQVAEMRRKKNGSFKFNITVNNCHLENKSDWLSWRRLAIHFSSGSLYQFRAKTTARAQAVESQEKTIWMSRHSASPTHTHAHAPTANVYFVRHINEEFFCIFTFHSIDRMQFFFSSGSPYSLNRVRVKCMEMKFTNILFQFTML